jgi:deoxyribose-phosphate aldolase
MTDAGAAATDARRILGLLDLTDLGDSCTDADVTSLCTKAVTAHGNVAAVCVWPKFVPLAVGHLVGTGVEVATVVNFPSGDESIDQIVSTTRKALEDGADEIDLVLPYRAFLAGDLDRVTAVLDSVRSVVATPRRLKVILESGELESQSRVADAARLAISHGADFVKTSTGKSKVSATPDAVRTMLTVIAESDRVVGIKPSGGIRTVADATTYLSLADDAMGPAWATSATFRFGASGLLDALLDVLDRS